MGAPEQNSNLIVIPARKGSQSILSKNMRLFCGKPLIHWTIDLALRSQLGQVCVSTDCEEIKAYALSLGAQVPFLRPDDLSQSTTAIEPVLVHAYEFYSKILKQDIRSMMLLLPTSPFRELDDLIQANALFRSSDEFSAVFTVHEAIANQNPHWMLKLDQGKVVKFTGEPLTQLNSRRQDLPKVYIKNDFVFQFKPEVLFENPSNLYGKNPQLLITSENRLDVDINSEKDWKIAELLFEHLLSERRIGFMQGRLSDQVNGKIQAFPALNWKQEFPLAKKLGLKLMEWTLDQEDLHENPFMTEAGQKEILALCREFDLKIPSLTGDCFMQAPFWKTTEPHRLRLLQDLEQIIAACGKLGVEFIVFPLVDQGSVAHDSERELLVNELRARTPLLIKNRVKIAFETDFPPVEFKNFMAEFDSEWFGVNYDMGNSAALGFNSNEEFAHIGNRIINVHVKDRVLGGTTVPLGQGNAKFETIFQGLKNIGYTGNLILQTARSSDRNHEGVLNSYRNLVLKWLDGNHG